MDLDAMHIEVRKLKDFVAKHGPMLEEMHADYQRYKEREAAQAVHDKPQDGAETGKTEAERKGPIPGGPGYSPSDQAGA